MKEKKEKSVFAENLVRWRKKRGFHTAKDFYAQLEKEYHLQGLPVPFTYMAYSSYENGSRAPKYEILVQLARFLDVSLDTLLDLYDETYILHFLTRNDFHVQLQNHLFVIQDGKGASLAIDSARILEEINHLREKNTAQIQETLMTLIRQDMQKNTLVQLKKATDLVTQSMALLLHIDFPALQAKLKGTRFFARLGSNWMYVLFFIYLTNCNPLVNLENAEDTLDEELDDLNPDPAVFELYTGGQIDKYIQGTDKSERLCFKESDTPDYQSTSQIPRIPAIEDCMKTYLAIPDDFLKKHQLKELKDCFFSAMWEKATE